MAPRLNTIFVALILIAFSSVNGCKGDKEKSNVILIVMDTVRSDHLSCYGYPRKTTPELEKFASSADLYKRAYTTAPWTLPSHASLFTGKYPFQHGMHSIKTTEKVISNVNPLDLKHITIAEVLRDNGYNTQAIVANNKWRCAIMG